MSPKRVIICLFRNDLRVHDNAILHHALAHKDCTHVLPLYCFDNRAIDISRVPIPSEKAKYDPPLTWHFRFPKCGPHRTKFILESVSDLQKNLAKRASKLFIQFGSTEKAVNNTVRALQKAEYQVLGVYLQAEVTYEETLIERRLKESKEFPLRFFFSSSLYHPSSLPFDPKKDTPDVFTRFRKMCEGVRSEIHMPLAMPDIFKPYPTDVDIEPIPIDDVLDYSQYFLSEPYKTDPRSAFPFQGGETAALQRLNEYFFQSKLISTYKETRNGLLGHAYSSKFSPWLAHGCISPRFITSELQRYEKAHGENESTYWLYFELLWRDYFKFVAVKYGNHMFFLEGMLGYNGARKDKSWSTNRLSFDRWKEGNTGIPFVDANMRELSTTGFVSNRGRQNVASFLTNDISLNWLMGAEWFESQLIDHDPASNYGNWQYIAGVGNDPRSDRKFNMIKQAKDYDPNGEFVKTWCPELKSISVELVQSPWRLSGAEMQESKCIVGKDYPTPQVIDPMWAKHEGRSQGSKTHGNPMESVGKKFNGKRGGRVQSGYGSRK